MTTWTVRTPNWEVRRHDAEDFTVADDVLVLHMSDSDQPSVAAYAPGQWNSIERAAETPTVIDEHAQTLALIDALKTKLDERDRQMEVLDNRSDPRGHLCDHALLVMRALEDIIDDLRCEVDIRWGGAESK